MSFASVEELKNLADNWTYENVPSQGNHNQVQVLELVRQGYMAGYDQALEDLRSELR